MIETLPCGCEKETQSFGTKIRLCVDHIWILKRGTLLPDFSWKRANDPTPSDRAAKS